MVSRNRSIGLWWSGFQPLFAAVFNEIVSGSLYLARSELQQAIRMIEAGEAEGLAMLDLERFARHAAYQEIAYARIIRAGGKVIFCRESVDDSPEGRLYRTIRGSITQYYREKQAVLSKEGSAARATQGVMPNRNRRPYGYRIIKQIDVLHGHPGPAGSFEIVPPEAKWVRWMFARCLAAWSLPRIADGLNQRQVPTMLGAPCWTPPVVHKLLTNSVHCGRATYGKWLIFTDEDRLAHGRHHTYRKRRPPSEWIIISVPAIVSVATWEAAQQGLRARGPHRV